MLEARAFRTRIANLKDDEFLDTVHDEMIKPSIEVIIYFHPK